MTIDVKLPDIVLTTCRLPGADSCGNKAQRGKSAGELAAITVATDAIDSVGLT